MNNVNNLIKKQDEYANYMVKEITHICTHFPKRTPGGKGEKEASHYMADVLKKNGCQEVKIDSFKEHPHAFYAWIHVLLILVFLSAGLFFITPIISLCLMSLGLLIFILEFIFYFQFIDVFFPKREGTNVTAIKKSSSKPKCRIILNGHPDATWNWNTLNKFGGRFYIAHTIISLVGVLSFYILSIIATVFVKANLFAISINNPFFYAAIAIIAVFIIPWIGMLLAVDWKHTVDGANDNLTGCYIGISVIKALNDFNIQLKDVELMVVLTGSEESGLRGSKAWCKKYSKQFNDIPTYVYSFDNIHDPKFLGVNYRDLNNTIKCDEEVCDNFMKAANELNINCIKTKVPLFGGATDGAAFNQGKFKACGITAMDHIIGDYYHSLKDTYTNLNKDCLAKTFAITLKLISNYCNK